MEFRTRAVFIVMLLSSCVASHTSAQRVSAAQPAQFAHPGLLHTDDDFAPRSPPSGGRTSRSRFAAEVTTQNWIGRSQFEQDPYFRGSVADFRIYHGALSTEDMAALARRQK